MRDCRVSAHWDSGAGVWWAESSDVHGLAAEAVTLEDLLDNLKAMLPELLALNHDIAGGDIRILLIADRTEPVGRAA